MEIKEVQAELKELATKLEGKSKEQITDALASFEAKNKEVIDSSVKGVKDSLEKELKAVKEHANQLDVKMKEKEVKKEAKGDVIAGLVSKNFDVIKNVSGKSEFKTEVKDMTLGNALTGDQPRDYNFDVVKRPMQKVNVEDLAQSITISGGTYTYTRSTLASGSVADQTEGALKNQLEYDYTMVDANTNFIAGFAVYSKKMRNNLPFLESTLSMDLRNDYWRGENAAFQTILASEATASTEVITGQNKIEMLIAEIAKLADADFNSNAVVVRPSDYYDILITEKSTGAGYGLPGVVTFDNGVLRINGIAILQATWLPANKYYVGDWSRVRKVVTEGFSFAVSEDDSDNFRKNNITARVEAQVTLTVEQPDALVYGDFTAV